MSDKNNTNHYEGALLEEIRDDIKTVLEGQQSMAHVPSDLAQLKDDMTVVKADIKTIKAVVTNHEGRITKIERVI
ncbi:MAG TPA: hypothetical protein VFH99_02415 [Candidatus Saccharimonadales bacterium]|nr:hypothetical protein [Candidatus Saccharimonadales bacterium]